MITTTCAETSDRPLVIITYASVAQAIAAPHRQPLRLLKIFAASILPCQKIPKSPCWTSSITAT